MIELNETEAQVYELLKQKYPPTAIAKEIGKSKDHIFSILSFLIRQGVAKKQGRKPYGVSYFAIDVGYTIIKRPQGDLKNIRPRTKLHKIAIIKKLIRLIGKDRLRFILNHHNKMDRRKIAEKVGIRKVDLNQIYILLEKKGDDAA